ncbi:hypothetical protein PROFUN_04227 [Planoprotostelium fungivorum]|uniref:Ubiquitin-like domain-containing protein n=1 Tax=Planoprotostelium fungivorum TaxID=1890364 RepID=A0A2P6NW28_9EUKA|nr:hypothetical protein PROFUN_04227 [Planoprotostelium fungivorum]
MTVTITLLSTGETFQAPSGNVQQLKDSIFEQRGIPQGYQMIQDQSGATVEQLEDGSQVNLSVQLNGGCSEACSCCGGRCGESCHCTIL